MTFLLDHDVPDDLSYMLRELGHTVLLLREVLPADATDPVVLRFAQKHGYLLVTCNRDDFLRLATEGSHDGIIVVIRRKTRAAERAALLRLILQAGESGLKGNITFA